METIAGGLITSVDLNRSFSSEIDLLLASVPFGSFSDPVVV
jgi:hypothetical protein